MRPRTLKSAAEHGDLDAVKYHLSRGAEINATTAAGHFALGGAIIKGHPHIVEYLIANGADIDQESEFGWTPLYLAAWTGSAESRGAVAGSRCENQYRTRAAVGIVPAVILRCTLPQKQDAWLLSCCWSPRVAQVDGAQRVVRNSALIWPLSPATPAS